MSEFLDGIMLTIMIEIIIGFFTIMFWDLYRMVKERKDKDLELYINKKVTEEYKRRKNA
jgi:hypothetical protein